MGNGPKIKKAGQLIFQDESFNVSKYFSKPLLHLNGVKNSSHVMEQLAMHQLLYFNGYANRLVVKW